MDILVDFIDSHPIFSSLSTIEKATTLPSMKILTIKEGERIFTQGESSDYTYFILSGSVSTDCKEKDFRNIGDKIIGLDMVLGRKKYNCSATASSSATLVQISSAKLIDMISKHPKISVFLLSGAPETQEKELNITKPTPIKNTLVWLFAAIIPILMYKLLDGHIGYSQNIFTSLFFAGVTLWIFNIVHESVPGLIIVTVTAIMNIAPNNIIVSGFASDTTLLFLSLFGLSTIITASGLFYRLSLLIVRYTRSTFINTILFLLGILMTPIIPSMITRSQLIAQLVKDISDAYKLNHNSVLITKLSVACFFGTTLFSNIFFTGSLMNFILTDFLPEQSKFSIETIGWIKIALAPGLFLLLINAIALPIIFRSKEKIFTNIDTSKKQLKLMGKLSRDEVHSIYASILFFIAIMTISIHHIPIVWISMFLFLVLIGLGCIDFKTWAQKMNWGFFFFISSISCISATMKYLKLDSILKDCITSIRGKMVFSDVEVLTFIIVLSLLSRLILPVGSSIVILISLAIPISEMYGVNLLTIMFTLLIVSDVWFFPYQSQFYQIFKDEFSGSQFYNKKTFIMYNMIMNVSRVGCIYASIPYWRYIGVI